jgi:hypothetical protein
MLGVFIALWRSLQYLAQPFSYVCYKLTILGAPLPLFFTALLKESFDCWE